MNGQTGRILWPDIVEKIQNLGFLHRLAIHPDFSPSYYLSFVAQQSFIKRDSSLAQLFVRMIVTLH